MNKVQGKQKKKIRTFREEDWVIEKLIKKFGGPEKKLSIAIRTIIAKALNLP